MAKASLPIQPFPADIDRDYFGAWLSGFVDGEGCFSVEVRYTGGSGKHLTPRVTFKMTLRADDRPILELICAYLGCGQVSKIRPRTPGHNGNPTCTFDVTNVAHNARILIPQFERFPLLAKKRHDFVIWKAACMLCLAVCSRPSQKRPGVNTGWSRRWQESEVVQMEDYLAALKEVRKYNGIVPEIQERLFVDEQPLLF